MRANIVSVGYGGATGSTGSLTPGSEISPRDDLVLHGRLHLARPRWTIQVASLLSSAELLEVIREMTALSL